MLPRRRKKRRRSCNGKVISRISKNSPQRSPSLIPNLQKLWIWRDSTPMIMIYYMAQVTSRKGDYPGGPYWITWVPKAREHSPDGVKRGDQEDSKHQKDTFLYCWLWNGGGTLRRNAGRSLGIEAASYWQPAKKWQFSPTTPRTTFCQQLEWVWKWILSQKLHNIAHPGNVLISALGDSEHRTQLCLHGLLTFNNSVCCFKLLRLW